MNKEENDQLQRLIKENNITDCTDDIRKKQHSIYIQADLVSFKELKKKYPRSSNNAFFNKLCQDRCNFLYTNYKSIFTKLINNSIELNILYKLVNVLEQIENGIYNQHEGSFEVGKILKEIYIDKEIEMKNPKKEYNNISYKEFKKLNNNTDN